MAEIKSKKLNLIEATSLAVGTMIGASIFTLLATGAKLSGHFLPIAFLLSGILAFLVAILMQIWVKK